MCARITSRTWRQAASHAGAQSCGCREGAPHGGQAYRQSRWLFARGDAIDDRVCHGPCRCLPFVLGNVVVGKHVSTSHPSRTARRRCPQWPRRCLSNGPSHIPTSGRVDRLKPSGSGSVARRPALGRSRSGQPWRPSPPWMGAARRSVDTRIRHRPECSGRRERAPSPGRRQCCSRGTDRTLALVAPEGHCWTSSCLLRCF